MIAALYVHKGGAYYGLPDVDPWDEKRDARLYDGPWAVVAHPPCARWCAWAKNLEQRFGLRVGDDGGCFEAALAAVRRWGGVLEHPAYSLAWPRFGLPRPTKDGQWTQGPCGGWVAQVAQRHFGHLARKRTWLYAFGCVLPPLPAGDGPTPVAVCGKNWVAGRSIVVLKPGTYDVIVTPEPFRDLLLGMARSVER